MDNLSFNRYTHRGTIIFSHTRSNYGMVFGKLWIVQPPYSSKPIHIDYITEENLHNACRFYERTQSLSFKDCIVAAVNVGIAPALNTTPFYKKDWVLSLYTENLSHRLKWVGRGNVCRLIKYSKEMNNEGI